jgi:hypothetical protein
MRKSRSRFALPIISACLVLVLAGCSQIERDARDTAAALSGVLISAQTQNQDCIKDSTGPNCALISRGIAAQNVLITATETYCGWTVANPPASGAKCVPVASATAGLNSAISNASLIITEIKGVIK